jgi:hypothetical protein
VEVVYKAVLELDGVEAAKQLVARTAPHADLLGLDKFLEARLMDAPAVCRSCRW